MCQFSFLLMLFRCWQKIISSYNVVSRNHIFYSGASSFGSHRHRERFEMLFSLVTFLSESIQLRMGYCQVSFCVGERIHTLAIVDDIFHLKHFYLLKFKHSDHWDKIRILREAVKKQINDNRPSNDIVVYSRLHST